MNIAPFPYTTDPAQIPTRKLVKADTEQAGAGAVYYQCPDSCWKAHLDAWSKERGEGGRSAPIPMPVGHLMFENPVGHGMTDLSEKSVVVRREALENSLRANLDGWDRFVSPEKLKAIVATCVDAKLAGKATGVWPFVACIGAAV